MVSSARKRVRTTFCHFNLKDLAKSDSCRIASKMQTSAFTRGDFLRRINEVKVILTLLLASRKPPIGISIESQNHFFQLKQGVILVQKIVSINTEHNRIKC